MQQTRHRAAVAAAVAAVSVVGTVATVTPADAATRPASHLTVRTSEATPASGEQFVLRGRLTTPTGRALAGGTVTVQTLRAGTWVGLTGARVTTGEQGYYRVRVVLSQRGERDLRAVGDPAGSTRRNSSARLVVDVD